jgi:hypothetical protein
VAVVIRSNNVSIFQRKATSNRSLALALFLSLARKIGKVFFLLAPALKTGLEKRLPVGKSSSLKVVASNCYGCEGKSVQKKREKKKYSHIVKKREDCEIPFFQFNFESTIIFSLIKKTRKKN